MRGSARFVKCVLGACVLWMSATFYAPPASAQDVTLKLHHFLPAGAVMPSTFLEPWARAVEAEANGALKVVLYPDMQLGGRSPALIDQIEEGVADIVWTLPGYSLGRFPKSETFEMPFLPATAEATSKAAWDFYEKHLREEYRGIKVIAVHVHGPGLLHLKGDGISKLEDLKGKKLRGPTRNINALLKALGAIPVGMPISAFPEALDRKIVEGTVAPWEVVQSLGVDEQIAAHTLFSAERGLYTTLFVLAMSQKRFDGLPDNIKAAIEANSGRAVSALAGRAMDNGDRRAKEAAEDRGSRIITLNVSETERWRVIGKTVTDAWVAEMTERGIDAAALLRDAEALVKTYAK